MNSPASLSNVVTAILLAPCAAAQTWAPLEELPRNLDRLIYDGTSQRLLGIVNYPQQTWSFDGQRWRLHWPDGLGPDRPGPVPTTILTGYDEARREAVLVSSAVQWTPTRTYTSYRAGWRSILPASTPMVTYPGVAFDSNLNLLLAFGGLDAQGFATAAMSGWNGSQWAPLSPALRPSPRIEPAMACDRARNRVVLYGGYDTGFSPLGDTWEFDGSSWMQSATPGPATRITSIAYDAARQRVVMVGGVRAGISLLDETFEWSASQWQPSGPLPRAMLVHACSDATSVVIGTRNGQLWRRSGTVWTPLHTVIEPQVAGAAMALDATGAMVLREAQVGGGTWTWNGAWQSRGVAGPTARYWAGMAPYSGGVLLFGGQETSQLPMVAMYDETWHWNGTAWTQLALSHAPPHRIGHSMVAIGNTVLLFGGRTVSGEINDTWLFQAGAWTQLQPTQAPSPRRRAALVYDHVRQRAVLFGGSASGQPIGETWEWDGVNWQQRLVVQGPPPGTWPMAMTPNGIALHDDAGTLWLWDGTSWQPGLTGSVTFGPDWYQSVMRFDGMRQQLQLLDSGATWYGLHARFPAAVGSAATCGSRPELRMLGGPWLGSTPWVHCEGASNVPVFTIYGFQSIVVSWAPNCFQLATADAVHFGVSNALGQLDIPLAIPNVVALRGVQIHVQSAMLDGGPVFGASLSGELLLMIGG